jgi:curved DNA-binding protein CbpA
MRSAYTILGVTSDADTTEMDSAYHDAVARLAKSGANPERLRELEHAYKILKDPTMRAAHDRKLAAPRSQVRTATPVIEQETSQAAGMLKIGLLLVVFLCAAGAYMKWQASEKKKEAAIAQQQAAARAELEAEARKEQEAKLAAERKRASDQQAEAAERRLSQESQALAARAAADNARAEAQAAQQRRQAMLDAQRAEASQQAENRRAAEDARRQLAADKQRIRELCWQNYRRHDC